MHPPISRWRDPSPSSFDRWRRCSPPAASAARRRIPACPPADVTTIKLEPKTLPASFEYVGQTTGSKEVEVRARVTGILEKKLFQEGAPVKAGQALFVIDPKPLQAQTAALEAEVARAQAQKARDEREFARLKPLAERGRSARRRPTTPHPNVELRGGDSEGRARPDSPRSSSTSATRSVDGADHGTVEPRAEVGRQPRHRQRHAADDDLAGRSDVDSVLDLPRTSSCSSTARSKRGPARRCPRTTRSTCTVTPCRRLDASTARARSTSPTPASIRRPARSRCARKSPTPTACSSPGQFVRVELQGAVRNNALAVPQVAVMDGAQGKFVYVADKDKDGKDIAAVRPVTLGEWVDARTARTCGCREAD